MLDDIVRASQTPQPEYIKMLTEVNGAYCDIYNILPSDEYSNARGKLGGNSNKYSSQPTYAHEKLLISKPIQQTYSNSQFEDQYDAYMREDTYIITHKVILQFIEQQKVVVHYGSGIREFQIFKVDSIDGIDGPIIKLAYLSPLT